MSMKEELRSRSRSRERLGGEGRKRFGGSGERFGRERRKGEKDYKEA